MAVPDKIRVLIVDDISEARENIRRMLQFDPIIEVVGMAKTGREAIEQASQVKPDVIIMDINMPDMDGITATEGVRKKLPYAQVVILSVQSDPNYMRRAMLAGARDFLTKPPAIDELTSAVRRAGEMAVDERNKASATSFTPMPGSGSGSMSGMMAQPSRGKVIVVYGPKGGCGKTTVATNLAIALHSDQSRTALLDASMQFGDVTVFLNEQGKNSIVDLAPRAEELDVEVVKGVMVSHKATGLHILAAPSRPEHADQVTGDMFVKMVDFLRRMYKYIVIDTSSYLNEVVSSALADSADIVILITSQEIASLKSCSSFLMLADGLRIRRDRILFVMNKHDPRVSITPERVGESLRQEVVQAIPFDEKTVGEAINKGIPFVLKNKTLPISKSIINLSEKLALQIEKIEAHESETSPTSTFRGK